MSLNPNGASDWSGDLDKPATSLGGVLAKALAAVPDMTKLR